MFEIFAFIYLFLKLSLCSSNNFLMNKKNKPPFCDESLTKMSFFYWFMLKFRGHCFWKKASLNRSVFEWVGVDGSIQEESKQSSLKWSLHTQTATQRCSMKSVFWKYAVNLQENTHAEVWCFPVNLLHIFWTPFLGTPLRGCFCIYVHFTAKIIVLSV